MDIWMGIMIRDLMLAFFYDICSFFTLLFFFFFFYYYYFGGSRTFIIYDYDILNIILLFLSLILFSFYDMIHM